MAGQKNNPPFSKPPIVCKSFFTSTPPTTIYPKALSFSIAFGVAGNDQGWRLQEIDTKGGFFRAGICNRPLSINLLFYDE